MSGYGWAQDVEALTLTLLRGARQEEIAAALDFDPATERLTTFDSAFDDVDVDSSCYPVQVEELDGWQAVVEPGGFLLSDDDLLARLSAGGSAVSYFRNINAQSRFIVARDGRVVRSFDPVIPDYEPHGEPLPEERDLPFEDDDADTTVLALTLLERLTGVRVEQEWLLERPRRTWLAPEPPPYAGPAGAPSAEESSARVGFLRRAFRRFR